MARVKLITLCRECQLPDIKQDDEKLTQKKLSKHESYFLQKKKKQEMYLSPSNLPSPQFLPICWPRDFFDISFVHVLIDIYLKIVCLSARPASQTIVVSAGYQPRQEDI